MPFKFHLKKSRQYNVVSKNQYVICVQLLDATSIECTLSIDSIGQECLDNVTQRLVLGQPEYFSLRYICRSTSSLRWIDMDKPLKRQLEKDAKSFTLYLRVMYYIVDAQLIQDEMTRFHYYLQLKNDVLENKIHCNYRQACILASYSMQAEFGNYSPERHTLEYLQQCTFFPNDVGKTDPSGQDSLLHTAICQYKGLINMTQATAEELYISIAMQLEGYGTETFTAKDNSNNKVILGISINGIMVAYPNTQATQFYRWKDISNVINQKKTFRIEYKLEDAKQFVFTESREAKYIWRLCIAQHLFYIQYQERRPQERSSGCCDNDTNDSSEQAVSVHSDNYGHRTSDTHTRWTSYNDLSIPSPCPVVSVSSTDINSLQALLPSYRPAPDYETAIQMKYNNGGNAPQPYYANQSAIVGSDISCLLGVNRNRY
ncbi:hypothetical protein PUN28_001316 [Cardiocondyla obscurior]|uniref:protein-tyrosine-phosphatase n=2 Tax=Cardiocondyla obscurior TaxID=286306 RepID=A0AAW2H4G0_9HYME